MQHVAVEDLNVGDLELSNTIDDDATGVVLLTTRLRIEARAIEDQTEARVFGNLLC